MIVCTACNCEKQNDEFSKNKNGKFGRRSKCKECINAIERGKKRNRCMSSADRLKAYLGKHPEKAKEIARRKGKRQREKITDKYVRSLLGMSAPSFDLIELKRVQIGVMRHTKQLVQTIKEKQDDRN
jgi:hypothetical protein